MPSIPIHRERRENLVSNSSTSYTGKPLGTDTQGGTGSSLKTVSDEQHILGFHWYQLPGTWMGNEYEERCAAILRGLEESGYTLTFLTSISGPRVQMYKIDAPNYQKDDLLTILLAQASNYAIANIEHDTHISYAPRHALLLYVHTKSRISSVSPSTADNL